MPSALATQLSQNVSLNAELLGNIRRQRHYGFTYLFSSQEAAEHDLDSICALGQNGFAALCVLDPTLEEVGRDIFSNAARAVDRTVIPPEQLVALQEVIARFMWKLSKYLMEPPAGKVLEWLVRRYRINEFDISLVLECFMPYHESTQFAKMLSILAIESSPMWSFLAPFKKSSKALPRTALVTAMIKNVELARLVTGLFANAIEGNYWHRTLLNFSTAITVEYISRVPTIDEGITAFLLPAITTPLLSGASREIILGHFVTLSSFSQRVTMTPKALKVVTKTVLQSTPHATIKEVLAVLIAISSSQAAPVISKSISKMLKNPIELEEAIPESVTWHGSEKFYAALVAFVIQDSDKLNAWRQVLLDVVNAPFASVRLVEQITALLFSSVKTGQTADPTAIIVLSAIYQRHPVPFRLVTASLTRGLSDTDKDKFDSFILKLSLGPSASEAGSGTLALSTGDVQVRLCGLRDLLSDLSSGEPGDFSKDVLDNLASTFQDPSPDVITLLYNSPDTLFKHIPQVQLKEAIAAALNAPDIHRLVARAHLTFFSQQYCERLPEETKDIFRSSFWRYLLFTKSRQKQAQQTWKIVRESKLKEFEILKGCVELVSEAPDATQMAAINLAVSQKIAHNVMVSNDYPDHFGFFLGQLKIKDSHSRAAACLVLRALLNQLSGEHQILAASRIMEDLGLKSIETLADVIKNGASLGDLLNYESLGASVVGKPNSNVTLQRLQASILALLPCIPKPAGTQMEWLRAQSDSDTGSKFVKLTRDIYTLVNSASALYPLATTLLRAVFVNIKDDALLLLVGVCTDDSSPPFLQCMALNHAKAFLVAQSAVQTDSALDFQIIIPALLVALSSLDKSVRLAAIECIEVMQSMHRERRCGVYAVESIYGKHTGAVQVLSYSDAGKYMSMLVERRDNFVADASYLPIFNRETLASGALTSKAKVFKQRVVCCLLSHVVCWDNLYARSSLLLAIRDVSDPAKLLLLLPLVEHLLHDGSASSDSRMGLNRQLLFEIFDAESVETLIQDGSHAWDVFLQAIKCFGGGEAANTIGSVALDQLRRVLFQHLDTAHKVQICQLLLDLAGEARQQAEFAHLKRVLIGVVDAESVVGILPVLLPPIETSPERSNKRAKLDQVAAVVTDANTAQSLTFFAEAVASRPALASVEAMRSIFDALQRLWDSRQGAAAIDYVSQTLLVALDKTITSIDSAVPASSFRIDVLVNLVRSADNPQTSQQALLVISNAAKMSPEIVLHHVMPIFTFMGSNVFHRDDSYSFRVVQKAVECIVPIMSQSLKETHHGGLELLIGSRDFLRIFTDASTHVPRHRRTHFFTNLIDVLGPETYLAPVIMLLVQKSATRVSRQEQTEAFQTLGLPLAALARHPHEKRLTVVLAILEECQRLVNRVEHPDKQDLRSFLDVTLDEHLPSVATALKKQAIALLIFVRFAIRAFSDEPRYRPNATGPNLLIQGLLSSLVSLASKVSQEQIGCYDEVNTAARASLLDTLMVIPASDFLRAVADLTAGEDVGVRSAAIELFADRIALVAPQTRVTHRNIVVSIIDRVCLELTATSGTSQTLILRALGAVALSGDDSENIALFRCVGPIIQAGRTHAVLADALHVLTTFIVKLGPRMISYASAVVELSIEGLQLGDGIDKESNASLRSRGLQALDTLVTSIPTFLGAEPSRIIAACVTLSVNGEDEAATTLQSISTHIPLRLILPILMGLWDEKYSLLAKTRELTEFFRLCRIALAKAPRSDITDNLKSLFKMFLEAFDLRCRIDGQDVGEVEAAAILSLIEIVTKLNEATFKPLFRRIFDWAFTSDGQSEARQITFAALMSALLEKFKNLITPYLGMVHERLVEIFERFVDDKSHNHLLWLGLVRMLGVGFAVDEGVFWRDDRLERIMPSLVKQLSIPSFITIDDEDKRSLIACLSGFAHAVNREQLLKSLNLAVLMETRSENIKTQILALEGLSAIWKREGARVMAFASETVTFIEDLAESENDLVARDARKFKRLMDSMSGTDAQHGDGSE
ncbi:snoRNA-binding rRNA-processing protein utp10 [Tulasnella sp. JGI-2019a]|nr:snoRNA-binding rRNA-processing protein utp10 [Tulasnella sp. JGI-2019a]